MSFFDDASLVLIPSGYKASKVYSVKPTDGTGDLTFTRSLDTATRVGPDGLIEKVITNTFTHSENFPNAVWEKTNVAITANTTIAPNGTLTADSMLSNTISNVDHMVRFTTSMAVSTEHTASFYAKQIVTRFAYIRDLTNNEASVFDLQDGVVSFQAASHTAKIVADGSFYRVSITFQTPAVIPNNLIDLGCTTSSTGITSVVPIGEGIAIWGAMLQTGVMTTYIPTTTAAVSVGMLANVPRLDYLGGGCPKLILEPQRVNLVTFSEQLNNAAWTKNTASIVANVATSPAGFLDADRLVPDSGSGGDARQTLSHTTGSALTISYFVKKESSLNLVGITILGNASVSFNLDTNAFATLALLNGWTLGNTSFDDYGNGWKRVKVTFVAGTTGSSVTRVVEVRSTGNGTQGVLFYGCQAEAGSYATSYIPTLAAAVTRSADAASKTGISALIGQTEGTLFVETTKDFISLPERFMAVSDGTGSNRILILGSTLFIRVIITNGGVSQFDFTSAVSSIGTHKIALAYANNDVAMFIDGVQVSTSSSATIPAVANLFIGMSEAGATASLNGGINQALVFKTRLTNAQCLELTA